MFKEIEGILLGNLNIFSSEDLELLAGYNINTLGQLLGATGGLQRLEVFSQMDDENDKLQRLRNIILEKVLAQYGRTDKEYKMGLHFEEEN
jgi:hypothetical protein